MFPGSRCGGSSVTDAEQVRGCRARRTWRGSRPEGGYLWNVPDREEARWLIADDAGVVVGCGAVAVDPMDAVDPDRTGHAAPPRATAHHGPIEVGDPAEVALLVGDFANATAAAVVAERLTRAYAGSVPIDVIGGKARRLDRATRPVGRGRPTGRRSTDGARRARAPACDGAGSGDRTRGSRRHEAGRCVDRSSGLFAVPGSRADRLRGRVVDARLAPGVRSVHRVAVAGGRDVDRCDTTPRLIPNDLEDERSQILSYARRSARGIRRGVAGGLFRRAPATRSPAARTCSRSSNRNASTCGARSATGRLPRFVGRITITCTD